LTPFYKKPWDKEEFSEEAENKEEAPELYKKYSFKADTPAIGSIRMSALESLTHPWIDKISDKLIANLICSHGDNMATKQFTIGVMTSI
jgi:hypothetical protein